MPLHLKTNFISCIIYCSSQQWYFLWVRFTILCSFWPNRLLSACTHTSLRTSKILGSSWPCQFQARRIHAPTFFSQCLALNFFILSIWFTFRSTHHWTLRTDLLGLTIRRFYSYKRRNQWAVIKWLCLRRALRIKGNKKNKYIFVLEVFYYSFMDRLLQIVEIHILGSYPQIIVVACGTGPFNRKLTTIRWPACSWRTQTLKF